MGFEFSKEFIVDAIESFNFERNHIREVMADPRARRHVDQDKMLKRAQRLQQMSEQLASSATRPYDHEEEFRIDLREGYGDRQPLIFRTG